MTVTPPAEAEAGSEVVFAAAGKAGGLDYSLSAARFGRHADLFLGVGGGERIKKGGRYEYSTAYAPVARKRIEVGGRKIKTRLGERGRIGMRFHPKRKTITRFGPCDRFIETRGVLRGHLRFRGEARYVEILRHRVEATKMEFRFKRRCGANLRQRVQPVGLLACGEDASLLGIGRRSGRTELYGFSDPIRSRGLFTFSYLASLSGPESFAYEDDLSAATLEPPEPFRGTAIFAGGVLSGDLRFSLPATKRLRIAPAEAVLVRRDDDLSVPKCFEDSFNRGGVSATGRLAAIAMAGGLRAR